MQLMDMHVLEFWNAQIEVTHKKIKCSFFEVHEITYPRKINNFTVFVTWSFRDPDFHYKNNNTHACAHTQKPQWNRPPAAVIKVHILQEKMSGYAKDGRYFELFSDVCLFSLDVILQCAFSYRSDCQNAG